ncbi:unnamed protein product, partial [Prorocentrum cordatum]
AGGQSVKGTIATMATVQALFRDANMTEADKARLVDNLSSQMKELELQLPSSAGIAKISSLLSKAKE